MSTRSLASSLSSQYHDDGNAPPVPAFHPNHPHFMPRDPSMTYPPGGMPPDQQRPPFPRSPSGSHSGFPSTPQIGPSTLPLQDDSPPPSPVEQVYTGPVTSSITAQMKCKVYLQQQHAQWKSLGTAKLKLYVQQPINVKQLVVEADKKEKTMLISTIVLTDGVERVGRTGVAVELSDKGSRTGIVYMIQLRNESSASGLFDSLLAGSDRAAVGRA